MKVPHLVILVWLCLASPALPQAPLTASSGEITANTEIGSFVTRAGDQLELKGKPFRFLSFNAPELIMREEPYWGFNQPFEQTDLLETIHGFGGRVVRPYVMSIKGEGLSGPRHIEGVRQYNEKVFQSMDFVLAECNRVGVRIIVPFVDNWHWWGGIKEFCALRGKSEKDFYTDETLKADYKHLVSFVLNRRNTLTGKLYRDDPAVLAWETGNELRGAPEEWTLEMAEFIKSIDGNHLVVDGNDEHLSEAVLASDYIDIVVKHYYRGTEGNGPVHYGERYPAHAEKCKGKKPLLIGEFGIAPHEEMLDLCERIVAAKGTGGLVWSLRQHEAHGGFRSHLEGDSGFAAYHLPGFPSGDSYHEKEWLTGYQKLALSLSGLNPELPTRTPKLLPIETVLDIRWQGVPFAQGYDIQKSHDQSNWKFVGRGVSDASISQLSFRDFQPAGDSLQRGMFWPILFQDLKTEDGAECFYRLRATIGGVPGEWSEPVKAVVDRSSGPRFIDSVDFKDGAFRHEADGDVNSLLLRCKSSDTQLKVKLLAGPDRSNLVPVELAQAENAGWKNFQVKGLPSGVRYIDLSVSGKVEDSQLAFGQGNYRVLKSSEK